MIRITRNISIDEDEIEESFIRSSGPGGQNVNKVETAVQLRFDVKNSPNLSEPVKERLYHLAGNKMTKDAELIIEAKRYRKRERNRRDARDRLIRLIRRAAKKPKVRRKTKPSQKSQKRRVENKRRRGRKKRRRQKIDLPDDY